MFYLSEISANERNAIHNALMSAKDFVDSRVFNCAKQHSCERLEEAWIRYLKEDLKIFLEYVLYLLLYIYGRIL
jgi:hypothetical protein